MLSPIVLLIKPAFATTYLPNELQPKLDLPSRRRQGIKRTCATDRNSVLVEDRIGVDGRFKIRMVDDIEKLRPELNIEGFREFLDVVVLK